ncbi:MAG: hypothetical protein PHY34_02745 [Patescibacteria group bacterium]|nr:hypothetical protein [Patescibacteria group bacterium]MDD5715440.1 hypothetical protein [Patescibacteria group bacterium]
MKKITLTFRRSTKTALTCIGFSFIVIAFIAGSHIVHAQWQEPTAPAPEGNIYAPINIGPDSQAKKGRLLLDPLYNPADPLPSISYPLEVHGPRPVSMTTLEIPASENVSGSGTLIVDTDTLYVQPEFNRVGIGTDAPMALVDIVNGTLRVGSTASPISTGSALYAASDASYGVYGSSSAASAASVYGSSVSGPGVWGLNAGGGVGIMAESVSASAVSGESAGEAIPGTNVVAGVYASAKGLGAWAGYFAQRLYGSEHVTGRKFVQSDMSYSTVPYSANWELEKIEPARNTEPESVLYVNGYVWVANFDDSAIFVIDPVNGQLINEFEPYGPVYGEAVDRTNHGFSNMIYADGYIWLDGGLSWWDPAVTRITPDANNPEILNFWTADAPGIGNYAMDLVYDDATAGGPYIWTANQIGESYSISRLNVNESSADYGTYVEIPPITRSQCVTLDQDRYSSQSQVGNQCTDLLDNDADGNIDSGLCVFDSVPDQAACTAANAAAAWTGGTCTDQTYTDEATCLAAGADKYGFVPEWRGGTCSIEACTQAQCGTCTGGTWDGTTCTDADCTTQATCLSGCGNTWKAPDIECNLSTATPGSSPYDPVPGNANYVGPDDDERLVVRPFGMAAGIEFDGTTIWFSSGPLYSAASVGEGIGKINAADPLNASLQDYYCTGPARGNADLAYDPVNNQLWVAHNPSGRQPGTFRGFGRFNNATGLIAEEYLYASNSQYGYGNTQVMYDSVSSGGPFLWVASNYGTEQITKFTIGSETVDHTYPLSGGVWGFDFDRVTKGGPYVWTTQLYAGTVARSKINSPYTTTAFSIKGTTRSDIAFDGTNIWVTNNYADSISAYRAADGTKVGDYGNVNDPKYAFFDGTYVWVIQDASAAEMLVKIDPRDGSVIGKYNWVLPLTRSSGSDIGFDGRNLWLAQDNYNKVQKVDLQSCVAGSPGTCTVTEYSSYTAGGSLKEPNKLMIANGYAWFSHTTRSDTATGADSLSRINIATGAVTGPYKVLPEALAGNIQAIVYDGTYAWLGLRYADSQGYAIYKIDLLGCSDGTMTCPIAGKSKIYTEPGRCTNTNLYCASDADCTAPGECSNIDCGSSSTCISQNIQNIVYARVDQLLFDGTYVWAAHNSSFDWNNHRECADEIDNDGDGTCDYGGCNSLPPDPQCQDPYDLHEGDSSDYYGTTTDIECADGIDNDGNGLCDYDGAVGSPGCSGQPDPGCSSAADTSEETSSNDMHLTRMSAATGETKESVDFGDYCGAVGLVYDGSSVWLAGSCHTALDGSSDKYTLRKFQAGGTDRPSDLASSVYLSGISDRNIQQGAISIAGTASFGNDLTVLSHCSNNADVACTQDSECGAGTCEGDLVVSANAWGGTSDDMSYFGDSCVAGEFAKGITLSSVPRWDTAQNVSRTDGAARDSVESKYNGPSIEIGSDGDPRIAWVNLDPTCVQDDGEHSFEVLYVRWDSEDNRWENAAGQEYDPSGIDQITNVSNCLETEDDSSAEPGASTPTLALDADNNPHVTWVNEGGGMYYLRWDPDENGGQWETAQNVPRGARGEPNTVFDWSYCDDYPSYPTLERCGLTVGGGYNPSLKVDRDGIPHIAFMSTDTDEPNPNDNEISYRRWDPAANGGDGAWVTVSGAWGTGGTWADTRLDANLVVSNTGTDYSTERSEYPMLALGNEAPNQRPNIVWTEGRHGAAGDYSQIYFRRWNGTSWVTISGDATPGTAGANVKVNENVANILGAGEPPTNFSAKYSALSLYSDNTPGIAWVDWQYIFYRTWNGTNWVTVTGQTNSTNLRVNDSTDPWSFFPSVRIVNNQPHIAYTDNTGVGGSPREVYYRWWNGTNWVTLSGNSGSGFADPNVNVSQTPTLQSGAPKVAIDSLGWTHVVWWERTIEDALGCGGGHICASDDSNADCPDAFPQCEYYNDSNGECNKCMAYDVWYNRSGPGSQLQCRDL